MKRSIAFGVLWFITGALGCEQADPAASGLPRTQGGTAASDDATACAADEGLTVTEDAACSSSADDYAPRASSSQDDGWPSCISDGNLYVPFNTNISSLARVASFETIAKLLAFGEARIPAPQDFFDARIAYTVEQGIESRVSRREDEHYPPLSALCRDLAPEEQSRNADRCVGPARIRPLLNDAFLQGAKGEDPIRNAARIEAALLWFFYVSIFKEATSAAQNAPDVDSAWAKYTGGETREGGIGLSRYVRVRSPRAHDRIWDGLLAVRCWRDLDNPTGIAENRALQERARGQLDRALLRGLALIVRQRLLASCTSAWEMARILGTVLDREATVRDPKRAATLRAELGRATREEADVPAAVEALDAIFSCP